MRESISTKSHKNERRKRPDIYNESENNPHTAAPQMPAIPIRHINEQQTVEYFSEILSEAVRRNNELKCFNTNPVSPFQQANHPTLRSMQKITAERLNIIRNPLMTAS